MAKILDGRAAARALRMRIRQEIRSLQPRIGRPPHAVFIQVGDNQASTAYVNAKSAASEKAGIRSTIERLPESIAQSDLLRTIGRFNADPEVHAILVQLPLPPQIDENAVKQALDPYKDVDCFHPENLGKLFSGLPGPKPATPQGILMLLDHYQLPMEWLKVIIIGRSNLVGKPLALMMLERNATVTIAHSRTRDLGERTRYSDVIVAAAGSPGLITGAMVRPGTIVIDVGINYVPELGSGAESFASHRTRLTGDVDFATVEPLASYISPVPGGVGKMTIASVLQNTLMLYKLNELTGGDWNGVETGLQPEGASQDPF